MQYFAQPDYMEKLIIVGNIQDKKSRGLAPTGRCVHSIQITIRTNLAEDQAAWRKPIEHNIRTSKKCHDPQ